MTDETRIQPIAKCLECAAHQLGLTGRTTRRTHRVLTHRATMDAAPLLTYDRRLYLSCVGALMYYVLDRLDALLEVSILGSFASSHHWTDGSVAESDTIFAGNVALCIQSEHDPFCSALWLRRSIAQRARLEKVKSLAEKRWSCKKLFVRKDYRPNRYFQKQVKVTRERRLHLGPDRTRWKQRVVLGHLVERGTNLLKTKTMTDKPSGSPAIERVRFWLQLRVDGHHTRMESWIS